MACSPLGCVTACVVYGDSIRRFDWKTNRTADSIRTKKKPIRRSLVTLCERYIMCTVIVTQLQTSLLFTSEDSVRVSSSKPSMRPLPTVSNRIQLRWKTTKQLYLQRVRTYQVHSVNKTEIYLRTVS